MHCQKCKTPIRLDGSLEDLNPAAFKLLTDSAGSSNPSPSHLRSTRPAYSQDRREDYDRVSRDAKSPTIRRSIPSSRHHAGGTGNAKENPAMSFVMLTESQLVQARNSLHEEPPSAARGGANNTGPDPFPAGESPNSVRERRETAARLFEILSSRSDIDHPVCAECTELLVDGLQGRLSNVTKERDAYVQYLRQVNSDIPANEEVAEAQRELAEIKKREAKALEDLEKLEREKAAMDEELAALLAEEKKLDEQEEVFWAGRNAFSAKLSSFQNERDRINTRYDHDSKQFQRLSRTNVYNDTFNISHDGNFVTINGLRLGRSQQADKAVDWPEVNAAWGQTCLLLVTVAEKLGYPFQGYRLNPIGSTSTIEKIESPTTGKAGDKPKTQLLELYSNNEFSLGLSIFHRRFDNAMVAFLECLRQLGEFVEQTSTHDASGALIPGLRMPYAIRKDRIHKVDPVNGTVADEYVSIRLGFGQEEKWSQACKHMLTSCKFLLAHASNGSGSAGRRGDR
ncbi:APG6-domain-containing protein [Aulographum hederae CBS 113979]|uniref:APG6-domain-containing protein n=1 Tax=Aulographum hederae CBS 113979 TaxID=1176131 RepID=A0A6G1HEW1_9PEZI|nr:APG6-domain-containing protein [Aulographum hederae CBS 113979]